MKIALVLAMADNGVIGHAGKIPWRIPEDMRRFKALTIGKPVMMGRRTWDSLPRKPLVGRKNIVITRDNSFRAEGAVVVHSLDDALAAARKAGANEASIIGGAEIYRAALPVADLVHLTEVHAEPAGDVRMIPFDRAIWRETMREDHSGEAGHGFSYVTLERR